MKKPTRDALILAVVSCVLALSLYSTVSSRSPKIDLGTYSALGAVTAEETAKLLGNSGRVLVIARDTGADKNPSVEAELAAFQQTLKQKKGMSQVMERFVATPMLMMATGGGVPPDEFAKALQAHPDANALVLFCGVPPLADADIAALKKRGIKIVVVASYRPDYGELLAQGLIQLVIAPRPESPPPGSPAPRTLREQFDQDNVIVTAADAANAR